MAGGGYRIQWPSIKQIQSVEGLLRGVPALCVLVLSSNDALD